MQFLKRSTATTIRIGPFVDEDDGKTAETLLTISQADIRLSKTGGNFAQTADGGGATHDENGWYYLQLDGTDTNALGRLLVAIHEGGALPVWREFMVVTANVFDTLCSTDTFDVNVTALAADVITSAVFDESSAYPLKADDAGNTYIARTGADGDTLEDLSDEIAVVDGNVDAVLLDTGTTGVVVNTLTAGGKAEVQAEAEDALEAYDLDHLIEVTAGAEEPTDGSYLDQIMHKDAAQNFDPTTDSLEAIRDALSSTTITTVATVVGDAVTVVPYTTWEFTLGDLPDLSDAAANGVIFTVKVKPADADSAAILQVQEGVGLLVLNGSSTVTAAKASLTVAGTEIAITIHLNADQTGLPEQDLTWDIKKIITDTDDADQVASGTFHISDDAITKKLTV